jgi:Origin recognition complex winged helix C-terminal
MRLFCCVTPGSEEGAGSSRAAQAAAHAIGLDPHAEDACLAYQLFDQDPACVNVADWFQAFCEVHAGNAGGTVTSVADASPDKEAGGKGKGPLAAHAKGKKGKAAAAQKGVTAVPSLDASKRKELAARFAQATAELQFVGLIKPAKRRRGDYVQRGVHMPAAGMQDAWCVAKKCVCVAVWELPAKVATHFKF